MISSKCFPGFMLNKKEDTGEENNGYVGFKWNIRGSAGKRGLGIEKDTDFSFPSPYLSRPKWPMKKVTWGVAIKHLKWAPVEWTGTG